ncbi:MAG: hypothetical protein OEV44_14930 [Spirochaetota bacterium]|nr:hypothetical protein [Spirochaetota bacterium]
MSDETNETKGKIQIKPKSVSKGILPPKGGSISREIEELSKEVRKLKKQVGRLLNIAEHEENIIDEYRGKQITLKLIEGSEEKGNLKEITKFQIVIEQNGVDSHFYKSAISKYHF